MTEFVCPCCKRAVSGTLYDYQKHFNQCMETHTQRVKQQDEINQQRIKLNAAVEAFNQKMESLGETERAVVRIERTVEGGLLNGAVTLFYDLVNRGDDCFRTRI